MSETGRLRWTFVEDYTLELQFAELVQKTIVESHSFPPGHGFPGSCDL